MISFSISILLIIITAFIGIMYARYEGFNTLKSGVSQLINNQLPIYEIVSGAALAFAALLLIFFIKIMFLNKLRLLSLFFNNYNLLDFLMGNQDKNIL